MMWKECLTYCVSFSFRGGVRVIAQRGGQDLVFDIKFPICLNCHGPRRAVNLPHTHLVEFAKDRAWFTSLTHGASASCGPTPRAERRVPKCPPRRARGAGREHYPRLYRGPGQCGVDGGRGGPREVDRARHGPDKRRFPRSAFELLGVRMEARGWGPRTAYPSRR